MGYFENYSFIPNIEVKVAYFTFSYRHLSQFTHCGIRDCEAFNEKKVKKKKIVRSLSQEKPPDIKLYIRKCKHLHQRPTACGAAP